MRFFIRFYHQNVVNEKINQGMINYICNELQYEAKVCLRTAADLSPPSLSSSGHAVA
jgi:hypothetical protein